MTEPAAPHAPKPGPLHEVLVPRTSIAVLEPVIGTERYERLLAAAARIRDRLGPRAIWNVNSTAVGGGVAEMLQVLMGYIEGLDIAVRWTVIGGDPEFFATTKRLHNQIHGQDGGAGPLNGAAAGHYGQVLAANADELLRQVRAGDLVLLHDPQTAGLSGAPDRRRRPGGLAQSHRRGLPERHDARGLGFPAALPGARARLRLHPAAIRSAVDPPGADPDHPAVDRPVLGEERGTQRRHGTGDTGHHRGAGRRAARPRAVHPPRRDGRGGHPGRVGDGRGPARGGRSGGGAGLALGQAQGHARRHARLRRARGARRGRVPDARRAQGERGQR